MTVYQILAIVFFVLAFIALVISIILFFNLDIISVIGDLSGRTAKKQIEQIRNQTTNISYGNHRKSQSNHNAVLDNMMADSSSSTSSTPPALDSNVQAQAHESKRLRKSKSAPVPAAKIENTPTFVASEAGGTVSLENYEADEFEAKRAKKRRKKVEVDSSDMATEMLSTEDMPTDVLSDGDTPTDVLDSEISPDLLETEVPTDVLETEVPTDILEDEEPTDILEAQSEMPTGVLSSDDGMDEQFETEAPTGLLDDGEYDEAPTGVLDESFETDDSVGTTVLSSEESASPSGFTVVSEETVVNTDEVID